MAWRLHAVLVSFLILSVSANPQGEEEQTLGRVEELKAELHQQLYESQKLSGSPQSSEGSASVARNETASSADNQQAKAGVPPSDGSSVSQTAQTSTTKGEPQGSETGGSKVSADKVGSDIGQEAAKASLESSRMEEASAPASSSTETATMAAAIKPSPAPSAEDSQTQRLASDPEAAKKFPGAPAITRYPLKENISRGDLHLVSLWDFKVVYPNTKELKMSCPGSVCPSFGPCQNFTGFESCHEIGINDTEYRRPPAPENCPFVGKPSDLKYNRKCSHRVDTTWHNMWFPHVYRVKGVYVDKRGITFNSTYVLDRHGCMRDDPLLWYTAGELQVFHVAGPVLGVLYQHGIAFYHTMIELIPTFVHLGQFLRRDPSMVVAMTCREKVSYSELAYFFVGIPVEDMNIVCINAGEAIFAEELIQPVFQTCGNPSPAMTHELRRRYYLPRDGLPFYTAGWVPRGRHPLSPKDMARVPEDWVVVLARRPKDDRSLKGEAEIFDLLQKLYGRERVEIFNGSIPILEAKKLFNRAMLYVAVHGAAMTNMLFMPVNSTVLEIRPRRYPNACYHHLASACQIFYYLVFGEGTKETPLTPDMPEVKRVLHLISRRLTFPARKGTPGTPLASAEAAAKGHVAGAAAEGAELGGTRKGSARGDGEVPTESTLAVDIKRTKLRRVLLNYFEHQHSESDSVLQCKGAECPEFSRCESSGFPEVSACWNAKFVDSASVHRPPPQNCPKLRNTDDPGPLGRNTTCSHKSDFQPHAKSAAQVFKLQNVFVNVEGVAFNGTVYFDRDGCNKDVTSDYLRGSINVRFVKQAFNLVYHQAIGFYHGLVEFMPQFYVLAPLFRAHPAIPILSRADQWPVYEKLFEPLIGVPTENMKRLSIDKDHLYFVEELYVPLYQQCGTASASIWKELRKKVLLHPSGVPAFLPTWLPREAPALSDKELRALPADWVVVYATRPPGTRRAINETTAIERHIKEIFPPRRVVVFDGETGILEARKLFQRAALFVAGHGAGLSNMVFMPLGASVLEIRPGSYPNACYNSLAYVCSIRYHVVFGKGDFYSPLSVDPAVVANVLQDIRHTLQLPP